MLHILKYVYLRVFVVVFAVVSESRLYSSVIELAYLSVFERISAYTLIYASHTLIYKHIRVLRENPPTLQGKPHRSPPAAAPLPLLQGSAWACGG